MYKLLTTTLILCLAFALLTGCGNKENDSQGMVDKAKETAEQTAGDVADEVADQIDMTKDEVVASLKETITAWDTKIDELTKKKDALPSAVKTPLEAPLKELKDKQTTLHNEFDALTSAPVENLSEHKDKIDTSLKDVETSYNKVLSLFSN